jgi:hypothetical protein
MYLSVEHQRYVVAAAFLLPSRPFFSLTVPLRCLLSLDLLVRELRKET